MKKILGVLVALTAVSCGGGGSGIRTSQCTWNSVATSSGFCTITFNCKSGPGALSCNVDTGECICLQGVMQTKGNTFTSAGICKANAVLQDQLFEQNCLGSADMGAAGGDLAMSMQPDMAMSEEPDLAVKRPDLTMGGGGTLGCNGALDCVNNCPDAQCLMDCEADTKEGGWTLLTNLIACIFGGPNGNPRGACPEINGGVCDVNAGNFDPNACDACVMRSQTQGGACYGALMNCLNDMP